LLGLPAIVTLPGFVGCAYWRCEPRWRARRRRRTAGDGVLADAVQRLLAKRWSPEQPTRLAVVHALRDQLHIPPLLLRLNPARRRRLSRIATSKKPHWCCNVSWHPPHRSQPPLGT
jgi:hypothetical protein